MLAVRSLTPVVRFRALQAPVQLRTSATAAVLPSIVPAPGQQAVGKWLFGCAGMVFGMVVLGGVTRLTRSGLSMVEWKPQGFKRPTTEAGWMVEFDKYKQFPEYKVLNIGMTLDEFKGIWYMEWGHRTWGRAIGAAFILPALGFAMKGWIPKPLVPRVVGMLALGGTQGLIGWWMVRSGLEERQEGDTWTRPRVSPYRLATHLGMAFTVYSLLLWTGMDLLAKPPKPANMTASTLASLTRIRPLAALATGIIGVTAASGAFVAGNDAGHAYNDWPLMAGRWIPEQIWFDDLGFRNFFENTATVQFDHRLLAYSSLAATGALLLTARRVGFNTLPPSVRKSLHAMGFMAATQVGLGISTLMMYVPVPLGALHQAGALGLWSLSLWVLHGVRRHASLIASRAATKL